jgi:hypothetical protein
MATEQLTFAEELTLLAHRESDGKQLIPNRILNISLTAAELAELAALRKVELRGTDLAVVDKRAVGDAELDAVLTRMAKVGKTLSPHRWLIMINPVHKRRRYLQRLSERGTLKAGRPKLFGLIPAERYSPADPAAVREVRERLGKALRGQKPDARTVTLLALAYGSGLTRHLFSTANDKRIEGLVRDDWAGQAVRIYVDKTTGKTDDSDGSVILASGGS